MPISHLCLALLIVVIWGLNFIFIKLALNEIQPFLLCALRFLLASVPLVFFVKLPKIPFKMVALYGLVTFALQFGLLFTGMHVGMPPGMTSLLLQVQVFFSMFIAAFLFREFPSPSQVVGAVVSFSGIIVVMMHADHSISLLGFFLIMAAAAAWGAGNLLVKGFQKINMIPVLAFGNLVAFFPMLLLSLIVEGPGSMLSVYQHISWPGILSVCYIVFASTWIGYGVWNWLLSQHPVSAVVPFTLLVPIVGMLSSVLIFHESLQAWKILAAGLVISGLCINLLGARMSKRKST